MQSLPPGVTAVVRHGMPDGFDDRTLTTGSQFTQADIDSGRVLFSTTTPQLDAYVSFTVVDDFPERAPLEVTVPISSLRDEDFLAATKIHPPANMTLHYAAASTTAVTLRTPSGPTATDDPIAEAAYHDTWIPQHGNDKGRVLIGSNKDDILLGSGENDILSGGAGSNTLRGYGGANRFVFTTVGASDTVMDFSAASGDVLDLSPLLIPGAGTVDRYLSLEDGVLRVNANGVGSGFTDVTIQLPDSDMPTDLADAWDAGLIDTGSIVPRTTLFVSSTGTAKEEGLVPATVTFRRRGDASQSLTVQLSISGTATPGLDYLSLPSSITFAPDQKTIELLVQPLADDLREPTETVQIALQSNPEYDLGTASATVNILDLPSRVWLEVNERVAYTDFQSPAQFLLRRSGSISVPLTALVQTAGRATRFVDYSPPAASYTFAAGQDVIAVDILPLATATLTNGTEDVIVRLREDSAYEFGSTHEIQLLISQRPQTMAAWRLAHQPDSEPADEAFYHLDAHGDGLNGLMKFAFNLDPNTPHNGDKPLTKLLMNADGVPGLEYRRWPSAPEVRYEVWQSTDLQHWTPLNTGNSHEMLSTIETGGMERVQHYLNAKPEGGNIYLRLQISRP